MISDLNKSKNNGDFEIFPVSKKKNWGFSNILELDWFSKMLDYFLKYTNT